MGKLMGKLFGRYKEWNELSKEKQAEYGSIEKYKAAMKADLYINWAIVVFGVLAIAVTELVIMKLLGNWQSIPFFGL